MTECARFEGLLDDFVDSLLDEHERERFEAHAASCEECGKMLEAQRALLRAATDLRREVQPSRDLLPGIRRAVGRSGAAAPVRQPSWWLGLAASLLIAAGLGAVYGLYRPGEGAGVVSGPRTHDVRPAGLSEDFRLVEAEYEQAADELLASIEARSDSLPPEIVETLHRNLAIIDEAIGEIHAALESADSRYPGGAELLASMHQQKIHLLWRVSRLSS